MLYLSLTTLRALAMQIIRTLKLLAWEAPTIAQLTRKREDELKWTLYGKYLDVFLRLAELLVPSMSLIATIGVYVRLHSLVHNEICYSSHYDHRH